MTTDKMRLYYDETGYVFFNTVVSGNATVEQNIRDFKALSERTPNTFSMVEFPLDKFIKDMEGFNGYRVNALTKELEFFYSTPGAPDAPQIFVKPLTEQIEALYIAQADTNTLLLEFMEATLLS